MAEMFMAVGFSIITMVCICNIVWCIYIFIKERKEYITKKPGEILMFSIMASLIILSITLPGAIYLFGGYKL